jgi:hypothetical protein
MTTGTIYSSVLDFDSKNDHTNFKATQAEIAPQSRKSTPSIVR